MTVSISVHDGKIIKKHISDANKRRCHSYYTELLCKPQPKTHAEAQITILIKLFIQVKSGEGGEFPEAIMLYLRQWGSVLDEFRRTKYTNQMNKHLTKR